MVNYMCIESILFGDVPKDDISGILSKCNDSANKIEGILNEIFVQLDYDVDFTT